MIVVIGIPLGVSGSEQGVAGTPALAAIAAARAGATVELVGKVGDDPAGDAVVLALGRQGVGHAALLRDPGHRTAVVGVAGVDAAGSLTGEIDVENDDAATIADAADRAGWPTLEPEDIQLALRYLPEMRAIVVAEPMPEPVLKAVADAASYVAAPLVVVADPSTSPAADVVLAAPPSDPDGAFADLLGQVGAALDRGIGVDEAFREAGARLGVTPASV
jgi:ribokinase